MAHDLRFQVLVLPNAPWDEVLGRFRYVEGLGFDLVTTADHFVDWNNPSVPWLEAWTVLAAVARETTRIRLATYVSQIPLRHPALLARLETIDNNAQSNRTENGLLEKVSRVSPAVIFLVSSWNYLKQAKFLFSTLCGLPPTPPVVIVSDADLPDEMFELIELGAADCGCDEQRRELQRLDENGARRSLADRARGHLKLAVAMRPMDAYREALAQVGEEV
jgi:hypothetical protein